MKINNNGYEILEYDEIGIPVYIRKRKLSMYPDYRALCHWHEDIEFIIIIDGCMDYEINGEHIRLKKGNILFINSCRLHYGYSNSNEECSFYCVLFHPSLITTNKKIAEKFILPITQNSSMDYLLFCSDRSLAEIFEQLYVLKLNPSPFYEFDIIKLFHALWEKIYNNQSLQADTLENPEMTEVSIQKAMTSYIYQNYYNSISLDDIAAYGNVCRSKCCQIFKKYVGQSPMEFTNTYRLERSQHLLLTTSLTITDICFACGFNHLSYFSKQFKIKYGCTPRNYRKHVTIQKVPFTKCQNIHNG